MSNTTEENEYLRGLILRLMSEVRPYCRPSTVEYDVFPVFKEAVEYFKKKPASTATEEKGKQ